MQLIENTSVQNSNNAEVHFVKNALVQNSNIAEMPDCGIVWRWEGREAERLRYGKCRSARGPSGSLTLLRCGRNAEMQYCVGAPG